MLAIDRRQNILKKIQIEKSVKVPELSGLYNVTEETIRRDLEKLEKDGFIRRTYGGAVLDSGTRSDLPAVIRETKNTDGKNRIGKCVADMIKEGDTVMVDSSTSSLFVTKYLKGKKNIIITNSLKVPNELLADDQSQVILSGGILRHDAMSFTGHLAENALKNYYADYAIVSCSGLSIERGIADPNEMEAEIKKIMINSANKVIMVVDYTKFDHKAFVKLCDYTDVDVIVTDQPLQPNWETFFAENNIEVIVG